MCIFQESKDVKSLIQVFQYVMQEGLARFTDFAIFLARTQGLAGKCFKQNIKD